VQWGLAELEAPNHGTAKILEEYHWSDQASHYRDWREGRKKRGRASVPTLRGEGFLSIERKKKSLQCKESIENQQLTRPRRRMQTKRRGEGGPGGFGRHQSLKCEVRGVWRKRRLETSALSVASDGEALVLRRGSLQVFP